MSSFYQRQVERIEKLGLPRTVGYLAAAAAERVGVGIWLAYKHSGRTQAVAPINVSFTVARAMQDWTARDMEMLQTAYTPDQIEFFHTLFARGNTCVAAKWEHNEICCVGWIETIDAYRFSNGVRGHRIHACYTFPNHRGRGVYPQLLAFACDYLHSQAEQLPIFVDTSAFNYASQKGITKAGFVLVGKFVTIGKWARSWPRGPVGAPQTEISSGLR